MPSRTRNKFVWSALAAAALGLPAAPAGGQASPTRSAMTWTPLPQALQTTTSQSVPTVVVVTARSWAASEAFRSALIRSPEIASLSRAVRFAEMPVEDYPAQVKALGITSYPTLIAYTGENGSLKSLGMRGGFADIGQVAAWLEPLGRPAPAAIDPMLARTNSPQASGQAYPSEQQYAPPPAPPKAPPVQPPAYTPPRQQQYYSPPPQQQYYQTAPQQYVPAPAPNYIQTQTPAMIVQQAPQQIILAPPSPPQITVAMASPMFAPASAPMSSPTPNIFTQPMSAPAPSQPMSAPAPSQPMSAPAPSQPMSAPAPSQPMQAPQAMQAPQQVGQAPTTAMVLQAPGLVNSMIGTLGEHMARRKNPRVQMSQMPTLAQAPVANAPMAFGQAPMGYGQAPNAYAAITAYAPSGPPIPVMTPESTSFAPCNTYRAPCRFHNGPCPGAGGGHGHGGDGYDGGGFVPPPLPYPSASPQDARYHQHGNGGHSLFNLFHKN